MTYAGNFEEWSLNSEIASEEEIELMERAATDLLEPVPTRYYSEYHLFGDNGVVATFSTQVNEEHSDLGSSAKVVISKGMPDNPVLEVTFGYANELDHYGYLSDHELKELPGLLQDLFENSNAQPTEVAILKHLQAVVFCTLNAVQHQPIEVLKPGPGSRDVQHVADLIRALVDKNSNRYVRTKAIEHKFDDGRKMTVTSSEIIYKDEEDDASYVPGLSMHFNDPLKDISYSYDLEPSGTRVLVIDLAKKDESTKSPDLEDEPVELAIASFVGDIGDNTIAPSKHGVGVLSEMLYVTNLMVNL